MRRLEAVVLIMLVAAVGVLSWQTIDARHRLSRAEQRTAALERKSSADDAKLDPATLLVAGSVGKLRSCVNNGFFVIGQSLSNTLGGSSIGPVLPTC